MRIYLAKESVLLLELTLILNPTNPSPGSNCNMLIHNCRLFLHFSCMQCHLSGSAFDALVELVWYQLSVSALKSNLVLIMRIYFKKY